MSKHTPSCFSSNIIPAQRGLAKQCQTSSGERTTDLQPVLKYSLPFSKIQLQRDVYGAAVRVSLELND